MRHHTGGTRLMFGRLLAAMVVALGVLVQPTAANAPAAAPPPPPPRAERPAHPPAEDDADELRDEGPRERRMPRDEAPGPGRRGRPSADEQPPLTAEQTEQALQVIRDLKAANPLLIERVEKMMQQHPDRIGQILREHHRLLRLVELKKSDPKLYELSLRDMKLDRESDQTVQRLREAEKAGKSDEAKALRNQLRDLVSEHFEVRHAKREHELNRMERRLAELRAKLKEREEQREALIRQRVEELVGAPQGMQW